MLNTSAKITNKICKTYFHKLYHDLNNSQKTFIAGSWAGLIWYELKNYPTMTICQFMNKYKLRIKLTPYK